MLPFILRNQLTSYPKNIYLLPHDFCPLIVFEN